MNGRVLMIAFSILVLFSTPVFCENKTEDSRALTNQAIALTDGENYEKAEIVAKKALEMAQKDGKADSIDVALSLSALADVYRKQGQFQFLNDASKPLSELKLKLRTFEKAEPLYKRVLKIAEKVWGPDDRNTGSFLTVLAKYYRDKGQFDQAESLYKRRLKIEEKYLSQNDTGVTIALMELAEMYYMQGKFSQAEKFYKRSLDIEDNIFVPNVLCELLLLYREQERYAEARSLLKQILAKRDSLDLVLAEEILNLALFYNVQGKYPKAKALYARTLTIFENNLGSNHLYVAAILENTAEMYRTTNQQKEAAKLDERAARIRALSK